MLLVDTNVVSEMRKLARGLIDRNVGRWAEKADANALHLSVMSLRELETWVLRTARRDEEQGRFMRQWFDDYVRLAFGDRILPVTEKIARVAASLFVPNPRAEADALIAATALVHGMTVVTRNVADFEPMGVKLLNPWEPQ